MHKFAIGFGLRSRRLISCLLHQILATPLISSVPPLASFGGILSDVLKELDCTELMDAQEKDVDDTHRVVRMPEFYLTNFYGLYDSLPCQTDTH